MTSSAATLTGGPYPRAALLDDVAVEVPGGSDKPSTGMTRTRRPAVRLQRLSLRAPELARHAAVVEAMTRCTRRPRRRGDRRSSPRALLGLLGTHLRRARSSGPPVISSLPTTDTRRGLPGVNAESHATLSSQPRSSAGSGVRMDIESPRRVGFLNRSAFLPGVPAGRGGSSGPLPSRPIGGVGRAIGRKLQRHRL